jgi:threonine dehydrogenase-like Zn-dependent dehydrogenase
MRALTVLPGVANSTRLEEFPEPPVADGAVLVRTLALGLCGTDRDITAGEYGSAPPGARRLVLGHESLGVVEAAPAGNDLAPGDLVVGIVRRPDPVPCPACAVGEWDMCRNGRYTERGIKERHGFGSERFRIEPEFAVKVDRHLAALGVLLEPASIVAKAWDHAERIGRRARSFDPRRMLVTGAGPIGLLAALIGRQRGLEVHVLDRQADGPKPDMVRMLGATYHGGSLADLRELQPDIMIECTGAPAIVHALLDPPLPADIICLAGIGGPGRRIEIDSGGLDRAMVLHNHVVFGSVNANRSHYEMAATMLAKADPGWLGRLISRRVPLENWSDAFAHRPDDIKVVIDFTA